jgi:LCP family protein required for cell wall assembly
VLVVGVVSLGTIFGYKILAAGNSISTSEQSLLGQLSDLLFKSGNTLEGETDGRINIMLLAIGGEGHSGENLADTIMVASIEPKLHKVALLSIPRDLYVQVPDEEFYSKLNAVHAYGEAKKKNNGPELLKRKVEEITGLPIHYYTRLDFVAFKKIVDALGGVNIKIDNTFVDYWHKISFPAGTETMNGDRALAYVRARYVEGPEGGDFKRAARQQQMLIAMRDKIFSVQTAFDFNAVNKILGSLSENIKTSMQIWEMKRFFEVSRQIDTHNIKSVVLTTGPRGVLVGDTVVLGSVPASILKTRTGDYSEIRNIAQHIFDEGVGKTINDSAAESAPAEPTIGPEGLLPSTSPSPSTTPAAAKPTVEVRNGTPTNGLAKKIGDQLTKDGYNIITVGNAKTKDVEETKVYAPKVTLSDEAAKIADSLGASAATDIPDDEAKTSADILVILGKDATN